MERSEVFKVRLETGVSGQKKAAHGHSIDSESSLRTFAFPPIRLKHILVSSPFNLLPCLRESYLLPPLPARVDISTTECYQNIAQAK